MENWKIIIWSPNYSVSDNGNIKNNTKKRLLKKTVYGGRYEFVSLPINGKFKNYSVHRLVALSFIPNPENKPTINHKDCIRTNNHYLNLEWSSYKENNKHAWDNGLITNDIILKGVQKGKKPNKDYINKNFSKKMRQKALNHFKDPANRIKLSNAIKEWWRKRK